MVIIPTADIVAQTVFPKQGTFYDAKLTINFQLRKKIINFAS